MWWTAGGAKPLLPLSSTVCTASQCCFCHRDASRRQQSRGYLLVALSSRHVGTPFKDMRSPSALSDTASLCGRTGRLRRTVRNPLRSDRFLPTNTTACHLNASIPKLRALSNSDLLPSNGAYPRRSRRGIAPVQHIKKRLGAGRSESTPVETSLPTDTSSVSAKCVIEAGSPSLKRESSGER